MPDLAAVDPVEEFPCHGGTHKVYRFANTYGASVIVWDSRPCEMRVIRWGWGSNYRLDYSTPVNTDVVAVRAAGEVPGVLERIRALPYGGTS
jgi:hypothetical protein